MSVVKLKDITSSIYSGAFGSLLQQNINIEDCGDTIFNTFNNIDDVKTDDIIPIINVKKNQIVIDGYIKYSNSLKNYIVEKNDIIVTKIGNIGETFIFNGLNGFNIGVLSSNFFGIKLLKDEEKSNKIIDTEDLFLLLTAIKNRNGYHKYLNDSLTVKHISLNDFSNIDIVLNSDLKNISGILTKMYNKIKLLENLISNETKEFKYYQQELLSGRLRLTNNSKLEITENNNWKQTFVNKKQIKIPINWNVEKIKDVLSFQQGKNFTSVDYSENGKIKVMRIKDILLDSSNQTNDFVCTNNEENIKYLKNKNNEYLICFTGYNDKPNEGSIGKIYKNKEECYFTNELFKFSVKNNRNNLDCVSYILETNKIQKEILKYSNGALIKHAKEAKDKLEIYLPTLEEQELIVDFLNKKEKILENLNEQKNKCNSLINLLLKMI